jgi:hypothetical protein
MPLAPKKPKPLRDIRYFESSDAPAFGKSMPAYASDLFSLPKEAVALGQRVGRKCEELGISIGSADHLYLCFTPSIPEGEIAQASYAIEPWHRFMLYGLRSQFNELSSTEKLAKVVEATFGALALLSPASAAVLGLLRGSVESLGEDLRVRIRHKETKHYEVCVEQTVPVHPRPATIFVRATNLKTQRSNETKVGEVRFHDEAPSLVDRLVISKNMLTIHPRKSFRAALVAAPYSVPFQVDLGELVGA